MGSISDALLFESRRKRAIQHGGKKGAGLVEERMIKGASRNTGCAEKKKREPNGETGDFGQDHVRAGRPGI